MARPTDYTPEILAAICEKLAEGKPLEVVCRDDEAMPTTRTIRYWMESNEKVFSDIAHARILGEEFLLAECLTIADTPMEGVTLVEKDDGKVERRVGDMLGHRKLQIDTRLKLLAKWNPKKFGDRVQNVHTDADGNPPRVVVQRLTDAVRLALPAPIARPGPVDNLDG